MMTKRSLKKAGWIILTLTLLTIIIAAGLTIRLSDRQSTQELQESAEQELTQQLETLISEEESNKQAARERGERTATLESRRDNGNELGVAVTTFSSVEGTFEFAVIAQLGDPQPGNRYEAVLSSSSKPDIRLPLAKEIENTFTLTYETDASFDPYDAVTVQEVAIDGSTSDVLSGAFE